MQNIAITSGHLDVSQTYKHESATTALRVQNDAGHHLRHAACELSHQHLLYCTSFYHASRLCAHCIATAKEALDWSGSSESSTHRVFAFTTSHGLILRHAVQFFWTSLSLCFIGRLCKLGCRSFPLLTFSSMPDASKAKWFRKPMAFRDLLLLAPPWGTASRNLGQLRQQL